MAITLKSRKELDDSMAMEKQIEVEKNDVENEKGKDGAENIQEDIKVDDREKSQN